MTAAALIAGQQCPGARDMRGSLHGLCICCGRQDDKAVGNPPAVKLETGRWTCASLVPPAGWPKP